MAVVLICSNRSLDRDLQDTVLFRAGIEREQLRNVTDLQTRFNAGNIALICIHKDVVGVEAFIKAVRRSTAQKKVSIVGLSDADFDPSEVELLEAGANAILRLPPGDDFNDRVGRLIEVPARRDVRLPVRLQVSASAGFGATVPVLALNLSHTGILLESNHELSMGDEINIALRFEDSGEIFSAIAHITRNASPNRYGARFTSITKGEEALKNVPRQSGSVTLNIPTLQIADIDLPPEVIRLRELAYDLWWSFNPKASRLFGWIDPEHWRRYHNPVELLINVDPSKWGGLLRDPEFLDAYRQAIESLDASRAAPKFMDGQPGFLPGPVAYFSMEFGLHESLGMYSGGLGVLAGDHCKAASDLGLPLFGVGLLYRSGYFRQTVDADGFQQHIYPDYDFARLPVQPVQAPGGGPLTVPVDLPGRVVHALVWVARVGGVLVFFLDTDIPLNDASDRAITGLLYVRGREMRLAQEIVLGIGGVRAIRALGLQPAVWHMNEGHVAMLTLERVRERVVRGEDFHDACRSVRRNTVFTTHTPVPAGNETFSLDLVKQHLEPWSRDTGVPADEILSLGVHEGQFNLTTFSIRLSSSTNAVSELHGRVSSSMWKHLWPQEAETPIFAVTNGVHTETWIGPEIRAFLINELGPDWGSLLLNPDAWQKVRHAPDEGLVAARRAQKERLIRYVRERVRKQSAREGAGPFDLRRIETLLDPSALTIGFARRFATYKRALLLLQDMDRAKALLLDPKRPVQLIFAGKAHPADRAGQEYIRQLAVLSRNELAGRVVFLEDYDIDMARMLVQGVDVWLNTPRKPLEASGTSGQKAAINGALNLSIADGWWAEGFDGENGFVIDGGEATMTPEAVDDVNGERPTQTGQHPMMSLEDLQDRLDAEALYRELETRVVPYFFGSDVPGASAEWTRMMKASIATIAPRFSARRMARDYAVKVYGPAVRN